MIPITAAPAAHPLAFSESTVQDLNLAKALGYERATNIRVLIKRNLPMLEAMGPLHQAEAMVVIGSGAQRAITEYRLTRAQAAFIIAKAGTKRADSLAVSIAEIFAMAADARLVPVDAAAAAELETVDQRQKTRLAAIVAEEQEARSGAFASLGRGRSRRRRKR
ncbi:MULTISPECIES: hypothetical protein [unclassified Bosea (in: a-proteobacteria)]|uniref:hypothetical protein n=1 Tax=unclassified Bosea (in: a-proteobacteria) TaxID=2653178 RepID=UPI000F75F23B|nr:MULTISPECIES: hypothetical protein [unclassified Bosea (in: a-proteobacteria)]AZO77216.1 hypothetical protein BLM15_06035 [Bosea sp. Tri-49]RXT22067.1 hypothetical protein B5U98_16690 [Bosea sp. Tri-39]RXT32409.1 hypothetical protein B5U99_27535 [Bosea sp. Tri-54]